MDSLILIESEGLKQNFFVKKCRLLKPHNLMVLQRTKVSPERREPNRGGGLLKYDLGRNMLLRLEELAHFYTKILSKNETHFYTRATKFSHSLLKIAHYYFPNLLSVQVKF